MSSSNNAALESSQPELPSTSMTSGSSSSEELLLLREALAYLGQSLDPAIQIREMLRLLSDRLGLQRGRVALPDSDGQTLSIRYAHGLSPDEMRRGRYGMGEGVTGKVMATGEPQVVQDIDADPDYLGRAVPRESLPTETVAFMAVPLHDVSGVCGVLAVNRLPGRKRSFADDMAALRSVALLIGQLMQFERLVSGVTGQLEAENRTLKAALAQVGGVVADEAGDQSDVSDFESMPARVYMRVEGSERERIQKALTHARGNKSRAAQMLGYTLRQLNYRLKVLNIGS